MAVELLSAGMVSEVLGVNIDIVRRWIASGELPAVDVSEHRAERRRWRVRRADLEAFLVARQSAPAAAPVARRRKSATVAQQA